MKNIQKLKNFYRMQGAYLMKTKQKKKTKTKTSNIKHNINDFSPELQLSNNISRYFLAGPR